jgi:hypothetical protein
VETTRTITPTPSLSASSLVRRGLIAVGLVLVVNVLVRGLAGLLIPDLVAVQPLGWTPIVISSIVGTVGATVVYGLVRRVAGRSDRTFVALAAVALLVSFVPVVNVAPTLPGVTTGAVVVLGALHVTTAVVAVAALTEAIGW